MQYTPLHSDLYRTKLPWCTDITTKLLNMKMCSSNFRSGPRPSNFTTTHSFPFFYSCKAKHESVPILILAIISINSQTTMFSFTAYHGKISQCNGLHNVTWYFQFWHLFRCSQIKIWVWEINFDSFNSYETLFIFLGDYPGFCSMN